MKRLPAPVHIVVTTFEKLAENWFNDNYASRENGTKLVRADYQNDEFTQWNVRGKVMNSNDRLGEETVGSLRLWKSGRVELTIQSAHAHLFDDVEAIYRKMAKS